MNPAPPSDPAGSDPSPVSGRHSADASRQQPPSPPPGQPPPSWPPSAGAYPPADNRQWPPQQSQYPPPPNQGGQLNQGQQYPGPPRQGRPYPGPQQPPYPPPYQGPAQGQSYPPQQYPPQQYPPQYPSQNPPQQQAFGQTAPTAHQQAPYQPSPYAQPYPPGGYPPPQGHGYPPQWQQPAPPLQQLPPGYPIAGAPLHADAAPGALDTDSSTPDGQATRRAVIIGAGVAVVAGAAGFGWYRIAAPTTTASGGEYTAPSSGTGTPTALTRLADVPEGGGVILPDQKLVVTREAGDKVHCLLRGVYAPGMPGQPGRQRPDQLPVPRQCLRREHRCRRGRTRAKLSASRRAGDGGQRFGLHGMRGSR